MGWREALTTQCRTLRIENLQLPAKATSTLLQLIAPLRARCHTKPARGNPNRTSHYIPNLGPKPTFPNPTRVRTPIPLPISLKTISSSAPLSPTPLVPIALYHSPITLPLPKKERSSSARRGSPCPAAPRGRLLGSAWGQSARPSFARGFIYNATTTTTHEYFEPREFRDIGFKEYSTMAELVPQNHCEDGRFGQFHDSCIYIYVYILYIYVHN